MKKFIIIKKNKKNSFLNYSKKNIKIFFKSLSVVLFSFVININSFAQNKKEIIQPQTIKVSFYNKENSPKGKSVLQFKSIVEAKSKGNITVEIYPFNSLVEEENEIEALELGITDLIIPYTSKISEKYNITEYKLFDLPYLFVDKDEFNLLINSNLNNDLLNILNKKNNNLEAISFWGNDFKGLTSYKPIIKVDDFKGLNVGYQGTSVNKKIYNTLNAISANMSEKTVSNLLPMRKISAVETTASSAISLEYYKYQPYFINTQHTYSTYIAIMNAKKLQSLTEENRKILVSSLREVQEYHQNIAKEHNDLALSELKEQKVSVLDISESFKKLLKEKLSPVHEDYLKEHRELMISVYKTILGKE